MLTYFISQSNQFTVRTESTSSAITDTGSYSLSMDLYNLYTHETSSYNLSGSFTFNSYENILTFSQSLEGTTKEGDEYLVNILSTSGSNELTIYRGSINVFGSQSHDKSVYKTQRDGFISQDTDNDYIVL